MTVAVPTRINADFSRPTWVLPEDQEWVASPQAGVQRVLLDRVGREKARATSLVRYAPGSSFPEHRHPGGEEILVLSGTFTAEGRDHGQWSYLRNPPGSRHAPSSETGCTLFVKLWQMPSDESATVAFNAADSSLWEGDARRRICTLFECVGERVRLLRLSPGELIFDRVPANAEVLVLEGSLVGIASRKVYHFGARAWIRCTGEGSRNLLGSLYAEQHGALVYLKTGYAVGAGLESEDPSWTQ